MALPRGPVLAALLLPAAAAPAAAQGLLRVPAGGIEAGVQVDGQRLRTGDAGAATARDVRTWLALPLTGSVGGPGVLQWSLTLRPTFQQRSQSAYDDVLDARSLELAGGARFLGARRLYLTTEASRAGGTSAGGFGSRRAFATSAAGATLWWRNRAFPMQLGWSTRHSDDRWSPSPAAPPVATLQSQRMLRLSAASTKTSVEVRRLALDDSVAGTQHAWYASVAHTARWGRGSRLETNWSLSDERGTLAASRRTWSERLHLEHGAGVRTDHRLERTVSRLASQEARIAAFASGATVRLGSRATAGLGASRSATRAGDLRDVLWSVAPRLGVSAALPGRWRLSASAALAWEWRHTTGAPTPLRPVIDEPHEVPVTRSVILDEARVDARSVVIRRADGALVYQEGLDYSLVPAGIALRVDVPPGSRIAPGETILVSYRHLVVVPERRDGRRADLDVALGRPGLELRHRRHVRTGERGPSALVSGVRGLEESRTEVDVRGRTPLGSVEFEANVRRWAREGPATVETGLGASLAPPPVGRMTAAVGLHWSRSRGGDADVEALAGSATVAWAVARALAFRGGLESLRWAQGGEAQRFASLTAGADWSAGATSAGIQAELHRRDFRTANHELRASVRVVRRF